MLLILVNLRYPIIMNYHLIIHHYLDFRYLRDLQQLSLKMCFNYQIHLEYKIRFYEF